MTNKEYKRVNTLKQDYPTTYIQVYMWKKVDSLFVNTCLDLFNPCVYTDWAIAPTTACIKFRNFIS